MGAGGFANEFLFSTRQADIPLKFYQGGIGAAAPHASAKLEIASTTQCSCYPRVTEAQRDVIASPAKG